MDSLSTNSTCNSATSAPESETSKQGLQESPSLLCQAEKCSPETSCKRQAPLTFPPCVICEGKASGLHYGCNTCEACKNFFRRYLIRKTGYDCPKQNDCNISVQNKSNCSACRLAKCLDFGMCKSKSKKGRYSYSMRTETINKVKQLEQNEDTVTGIQELCSSLDATGIALADSSSSSGTDDQSTTTVFDEDLVHTLTQNMIAIRVYGEEMEYEEVRNAKFKAHYDKYMAKVNMFGSMNAVSMDEYKTLLKKYGIDIDGQFEACLRISGDWEDVFNRYCDFAKKIPGFKELCYNDKSNLLKSTHNFAFTILSYKGYSAEYQVLIEVNGEAFHIEEIIDKFMSRDYIKLFEKCAIYLQKLDLTKEEMALLITIATFSSDVCKLENVEFVEKIQMRYVDLLSQHLNSMLDKREASARFAKLLDVLTRMRDLSAVYYQEMKTWIQDDLISSNFPVIHLLMPEDY